jgi:hypothetical protein
MIWRGAAFFWIIVFLLLSFQGILKAVNLQILTIFWCLRPLWSMESRNALFVLGSIFFFSAAKNFGNNPAEKSMTRVGNTEQAGRPPAFPNLLGGINAGINNIVKFFSRGIAPPAAQRPTGQPAAPQASFSAAPQASFSAAPQNFRQPAPQPGKQRAWTK